ncbi:MAG TPA: glutaredoxin family protein [Candidatus Acidoferrales bacterium]|nr:glutaredoxin family protein [Candidatus Acidoferrales bacterium]
MTGPQSAANEARELTLYTRPGCHLCEEMKAKIGPLAARYHFAVRERNIDEDAALFERFHQEIPVLFLGERKIAKYFLDLAQFEKQLAEAAGS